MTDTSNLLKNTVNIADKDVENRLLDAAEELFCQKGFAGTSIRDITAKADCNVAAVNYHFGSKEKLYLQIFKQHFSRLRDNHIAAINKVMSGPAGSITLHNLLRSYATAFVEPLVGKNKTSRLVTLMSREMLDPHLSPTLFYDDMMLPVQKVMQDAIRKVCPAISDEDSALSIISIVGQLIHIVRFTEFIERDRAIKVPFDLNRMVEHAVNFSAAGIQAVVKTKPV
jgi:AcrR family transcriptional regulator